MAMWDIIVVTSPSDIEARLIASALQQKVPAPSLGISDTTSILAVSDAHPSTIGTADDPLSRPSGLVGSGGATLNALLFCAERVAAIGGFGVLQPNCFAQLRVLILHGAINASCACVAVGPPALLQLPVIAPPPPLASTAADFVRGTRVVEAALTCVYDLGLCANPGVVVAPLTFFARPVPPKDAASSSLSVYPSLTGCSRPYGEGEATLTLLAAECGEDVAMARGVVALRSPTQQRRGVVVERLTYRPSREAFAIASASLQTAREPASTSPTATVGAEGRQGGAPAETAAVVSGVLRISPEAADALLRLHEHAATSGATYAGADAATPPTALNLWLDIVASATDSARNSSSGGEGGRSAGECGMAALPPSRTPRPSTGTQVAALRATLCRLLRNVEVEAVILPFEVRGGFADEYVGGGDTTDVGVESRGNGNGGGAVGVAGSGRWAANLATLLSSRCAFVGTRDALSRGGGGGVGASAVRGAVNVGGDGGTVRCVGTSSLAVGRCRVHPLAVVERSIILEGAIVERGARVSGCVVGGGATVEEGVWVCGVVLPSSVATKLMAGGGGECLPASGESAGPEVAVCIAIKPDLRIPDRGGAGVGVGVADSPQVSIGVSQTPSAALAEALENLRSGEVVALPLIFAPSGCAGGCGTPGGYAAAASPSPLVAGGSGTGSGGGGGGVSAAGGAGGGPSTPPSPTSVPFASVCDVFRLFDVVPGGCAEECLTPPALSAAAAMCEAAVSDRLAAVGGGGESAGGSDNASCAAVIRLLEDLSPSIIARAVAPLADAVAVAAALRDGTALQPILQRRFLPGPPSASACVGMSQREGEGVAGTRPAGALTGQRVGTWSSGLLTQPISADVAMWPFLRLLDIAVSSQTSLASQGRAYAAIAAALALAAGPTAGLRCGPAANPAFTSVLSSIRKGSSDHPASVAALAAARAVWLSSPSPTPQLTLRAARHYDGAASAVTARCVETAADAALPPSNPSPPSAAHWSTSGNGGDLSGRCSIEDGKVVQIPRPPSRPSSLPSASASGVAPALSAVPFHGLPPEGVFVVAQMPARVDLSGGWSDTPPPSYEHGGAVVNVGVRVHGCAPIVAVARRTKLPQRITFRVPTGPPASLKPFGRLYSHKSLLVSTSSHHVAAPPKRAAGGRGGVGTPSTEEAGGGGPVRGGGSSPGDAFSTSDDHECQQAGVAISFDGAVGGAATATDHRAVDEASLEAHEREVLAAFPEIFTADAATFATCALDLAAHANPAAPAALLQSVIIALGVDKLVFGESLEEAQRSASGDSSPPPAGASASSATTRSAPLSPTRWGLEVGVSSRLPAGSGLGGSSLIAAAAAVAISTAVGRPLSRLAAVHLVLRAEQLMSCGGGWQDQAGGLFGGVKLATSPPTLPLRVSVRTLEATPEVMAAFKQRLLLIDSGRARLARNLLQNVLRRWAERSPEIETTMLSLVEGARELAAVVEGASESSEAALGWEGSAAEKVGAAIDAYWQAKQRMAGSGVEPAFVRKAMDELREKRLISGWTLAGAGGGGFIAVWLADGVSRGDIDDVLRSSNSALTTCQTDVDSDGVVTMVGGVRIELPTD